MIAKNIMAETRSIYKDFDEIKVLERRIAKIYTPYVRIVMFASTLYGPFQNCDFPLS